MELTLKVICFGIHCIAMSRNLLKIKYSRVCCVLVVQKSHDKKFVTKICNTILFQNTINRRLVMYDWGRGLLSPFLHPTSPQMSSVKSGKINFPLKRLMFNPCRKNVHISKFWSRLKRHCFGDITFFVGCSNCQHLKRVELFDCQLITKAGTRKLRVTIACYYLCTFCFFYFLFAWFSW